MSDDDNIPLGDWGAQLRNNRSRKPDPTKAAERLLAVKKREKPEPRICFKCKNALGCFAFTWKQDGKTQRNYFHPTCFREFIRKVETGE